MIRKKFFRRREPLHKINHFIKAEKVRLVGDNIEQGVYALGDALVLAEKAGLDLVEVSQKSNPPICQVVDYSKFLYKKKKKDKEIKAKTHKTVLKEIRFTPNTDEHDFVFKAKHAEKFLKEGAKVKAFVHFRGRSISFKEKGEILLLRLAQELEKFGSIEQMPKLEGKRMHIILNPISSKPAKSTKSTKSTKSNKG